MPRPLTFGTPARSADYVPLRPAYRMFLPALVLMVVVVLVFLAAQLLGLRAPLSPGRVSAKHATFDGRCQECHVSARGVSNLRCERCHDPSSGGRLDHATHVLFGSLDERKARHAPQRECVSCHVEHRGATLTAVGQGQCVRCHDDAIQVAHRIRNLAGHPEFDVLVHERRQATGLVYSHLTHLTRGKGKSAGYLLLDKERRAQGIDTPGKACFECHRVQPRGDDFLPLDFDTHCLSCHRSDLKMSAVPAVEVVPFDRIEALSEGNLVRAEDFETQAGRIQKIRVQHRDAWILFNLRKLNRELDPAGFEKARAALVARQVQLERRISLAQPPAHDDAATLRARSDAARQEMTYIDARLAAQAQAVAPQGGARVDEIATAALQVGDSQAAPQAADVQRQAASLRDVRTTRPLSASELDERKAEVLRLLDAVEKADPTRVGEVNELRRRLGPLAPGQTSKELLQQARAQRQVTLERLQEELALRESGTAPPPDALLQSEAQALRRARSDVQAEIALYDAVPAPTQPLSAQTQASKQDALAGLSSGCRYCHQISPLGVMARVKGAEPVLRRARFVHRQHLTKGEACASCHQGGSGPKTWSIETSAVSEELNFKGIDNCRECHQPRGAGDACLECHRYHPEALP